MNGRQTSRPTTVAPQRRDPPVATLALRGTDGLNSSSAKLSARQSFPIALPGVAHSVSVSPAHFLAISLGNRWRTYADQHRNIQQNFSVEPVHEMRVASRRLMAQLDLLDAVVPGNAIERARRVLKRRVRSLG